MGIGVAGVLVLLELAVFRARWFWEAEPRSDVGIFVALEKDFRAARVAPKVILFGDSRLRDAVDARALEQSLDLARGEVLNLALTSGTPWDALLFLRRNPGLLEEARLVIYQPADWQFNENFPPTNRTRRFASLNDRLAYRSFATRAELVAGYFIRAIAAKRVTQGHIRGLLIDTPKRLLRKSRRPPPLVDPRTGHIQFRLEELEVGPESVDPTGEVEEFYSHFSYSQRTEADLRRLIWKTRESGADFVLVELPAREAFVREVAARHAREHRLCTERTAHLSQELAVPYWNDPNCKLAAGITERDFYDYGHLTLRGGRKYARWLAEKMRSSAGRTPLDKLGAGKRAPTAQTE